MNDLESLLMTIVLSDIKNAGTVKELLKDFNIYQKSRQSILLRVFVPKSLIGDQIMTQYFDTSGQMITESGVYTALKMGMVRVDDKGKKTKTDSFYLRYIKEVKTKKGEFYIYERMFPSAFTLIAGTGINAPKIVFNLVNILNNISIDSSGVIIDEPTIVNKFTTQECKVDVLPSTGLDQDSPSEPGEVELIQGQIDLLNKNINSKADKDKVIYKYDLEENLPNGVTFNKDEYKTPNTLFLNAEYDLPNMEYSTDRYMGSVLVTNDRQEGETIKQIELFFYDTGISQRTIELNQDLSVKKIGGWSIKVDRKQNLSHAGEFLYVDKNGNINFTKALKDLITRSQGELLTEDTSSYDFSSMFNVTAKNKEEIVIDGADELKAVIKEIDYDLEKSSFDFERYNGKKFTIQLPTKLSQFENDTEYITKDVNNLTNYTITDKVGNRLTFLVDPLTYVLTVNLLNPKGEVISTGQVDLPLESMVISASYENGYITLTLQNGETTRFSIAALISGLVPTTRKINGKPLTADIEIFIPENLSDLIEDATHRTVTDSEKTKWNNKVDKVTGKGLSTNDFTNDLKSNVEQNTNVRHSHSNKELLDTYKQTEANLADAVSKKHTHSNKSVLDNTTASYTTAEKNKLSGIAAGAEVNVQADWNEANTSSKAFIKNKPNIPEGAKLYSDTGSNTDGAMTQKAATDTFAALKSNQTFTGQNTFTQEIVKTQANGYAGFKIVNTGYKRGSVPSATIGLGRFVIYDLDGQYLAYMQTSVSNTGTIQTSIGARQTTEEGGSSWKSCFINIFASKSYTWANISGTFQPASTNQYSLGEPNFRWKMLYLSGKIDTTFGTTSYINANKGDVPFNIDRPAGSFNMIANVKSTNGTYIFGAYQTAFRLYYTAKTTIDAGTNNITRSWNFNEDGTMQITAPNKDDNSNKVPTTAWTRNHTKNMLEYDLVIRTQAEFETWYNTLDAGTCTAKSILFVGDGGTLKFTRSDGKGLKIPGTLGIMQGANNAIIEINNFVYNSSDNLACIYYASRNNPIYYTYPTPYIRTMRDLSIICNSSSSYANTKVLYNCLNVINCDIIINANKSGAGGTGLYYCENVINTKSRCKGWANGAVSYDTCTNLINCFAYSFGYTDNQAGYLNCKNLVNCKFDNIDNGYLGDYGFKNCIQLLNCQSMANVYGFYKCNTLSNCLGEGNSGDSGSPEYGYGFYDCTNMSNCKQLNESKTAMFNGRDNSSAHMPSYVNRVEFIHNTEYTAPCSGYVYNQTNARSTHTLQTIISGLEFSSLSYDGNKLNRHNHFIPVNIGDTFKTTETSDNRYFIPTVSAVESGQWKGNLT